MKRCFAIAVGLHARGQIGLQYGAGVVKFSNVQIRPLGR